MADWELILSCTKAVIDGDERTYEKSVIVENTTRALAIPLGIRECLSWAAEETKDGFVPVPLKAIEYWDEASRTGGLQFYEIQSTLDTNWGVSFIIKEKAGELPIPAHRNGRAGPPPPPAGSGDSSGTLPDLRTMLQQRLALLHEREKTLTAQLDRLNDDYAQTREDIRQTGELLLTLGVPKRAGRMKDQRGTK